jgi:hypothetical protein
MKNFSLYRVITIAAMLCVAMSSCTVIKDIFKAGMVIGIIGVVIVVMLIMWVIRLFSGNKGGDSGSAGA